MSGLINRLSNFNGNSNPPSQIKSHNTGGINSRMNDFPPPNSADALLNLEDFMQSNYTKNQIIRAKILTELHDNISLQ
jgi:hypothetical protein